MADFPCNLETEVVSRLAAADLRITLSPSLTLLGFFVISPPHGQIIISTPEGLRTRSREVEFSTVVVASSVCGSHDYSVMECQRKSNRAAYY